jgi:hypothetical protein
MFTQFVSQNSAWIRIGNAYDDLFGLFPGQAEISEMFKMEWLKAAENHAISVAHKARS